MTFHFFLSPTGVLKNIHLTITTQKNIYQFKTSMRITLSDWDIEKQRPVNIYLKKHKRINQCINKIKIHLSELIESKKYKNKVVTQSLLSEEVTKICRGKESSLPENSLLHFIKSYLLSRTDLICNSTYKRYKVFYNLLERMEGYLSRRLYVEQINIDFIKDFLQFARSEKYSENTIYRTIYFVKTILKYAERNGVRTLVNQLEIRRDKQFKSVIILTESEILQIHNTPVPKVLESAKDWLLISCYTGQRFSDFIQFKPDKLQNIHGKTCIGFTQQKTRKEILLPLHPIVMNVLKKNNNRFPKVMTLQNYNQDIKKISELASLSDLIRGRKRIDHRSEELMFEKWQLISSHIGRRSFASNFYGKIPTPLLMDATGHSSEQVFLKYVNPINSERIISLSNYFDDIYIPFIQ